MKQEPINIARIIKTVAIIVAAVALFWPFDKVITNWVGVIGLEIACVIGTVFIAHLAVRQPFYLYAIPPLLGTAFWVVYEFREWSHPDEIVGFMALCKVAAPAVAMNLFLLPILITTELLLGGVIFLLTQNTPGVLASPNRRRQMGIFLLTSGIALLVFMICSRQFVIRIAC